MAAGSLGSVTELLPPLFLGRRGVPPGDLAMLATARSLTLPMSCNMSPVSGGLPAGVARWVATDWVAPRPPGTWEEGWICPPSPSPVVLPLGVDVTTPEFATRCTKTTFSLSNPTKWLDYTYLVSWGGRGRGWEGRRGRGRGLESGVCGFLWLHLSQCVHGNLCLQLGQLALQCSDFIPGLCTVKDDTFHSGTCD